MTDQPTRPGLPRGTIPILATASGIAVSNIYFVQPLLHAIAQGLEVSDRSAGLVATAAQIGYALGISMVVPLADTANLRRLTTILLSVTTAALLAGAAAPGVATLALATFVLATTTVLPQIVLPTVTAMAPPGQAGRVIGALSTGLIMGVLLSRTISGAVGELSGSWRTAYLLGGALTFALIFLVPRYMPVRDPRRGPTIAYSALLASLPRLLLAHPELRLSAWIGMCVFAAFNAFWATLAFHLASPQFGLGPAYAGLFGLAAGPGAYLATFAGRLSDRLGPGRINLLALLSLSLAFVIFGMLGDSSLVAIAIGVNFLGFGSGSTQIANQTRIFRLPAEIRARLNTVYMVSAFTGGALGSFIAIAAFSSWGWLGVVATAGSFLALGLVGLARAGMRRRS